MTGLTDDLRQQFTVMKASIPRALNSVRSLLDSDIILIHFVHNMLISESAEVKVLIILIFNTFSAGWLSG